MIAGIFGGRKDRPVYVPRTSGVRGDLRSIVDNLESENPQEVASSIASLAEFASSALPAPLISAGAHHAVVRLLSHPDPFIRGEALKALTWMVNKGAGDYIVAENALPAIIACVVDQERLIRIYALAAFYQLIQAGFDSYIIYNAGIQSLASDLIGRDQEESSMIATVALELAKKGHGQPLAQNGLLRVLFLIAGDPRNDSSPMAKQYLTAIATQMGLDDIDILRRNVQELDSAAFHEFSDGISHSSGAAVYSGPAKPRSESNEEFEIKDDELEVHDPSEKDEDYVLYNSNKGVFPFTVLASRLRDVRMLKEEGVLGDREYSELKRNILNDIRISTRLDCLDCYSVLGVKQHATENEIKDAYKTLATMYHPDKVSKLGPRLKDVATEEMVRLNHAKDILMDPESRRKHDFDLATARDPGVGIRSPRNEN
jgi:DnaJ-domain-containing protein 1